MLSKKKFIDHNIKIDSNEKTIAKRKKKEERKIGNHASDSSSFEEI